MGVKMKAEVNYISALYIGEAGKGFFFEISEVCEVLLFECSSPDQEAVLYNKFDTIVLKKGDIRTCFHDAKTNYISFHLSKPLENNLEDDSSFQTLTFKLIENGNPMHKNKSEFYLFLNFALKYFHDVKLQPMKNAKDLNSVISTEENFEKKLFSLSNSPFDVNFFYDVKYKFYLR